MKKYIYILALVLITAFQGYGQTYNKHSQNESSNGLGTTEQYVYTYPSTGDLTIDVSLDILTIAKNEGAAPNITQTLFGYGVGNSIPSDWTFEIVSGTDYMFSGTTVTYTGGEISTDLNVNLTITFDDGKTLTTFIKYRLVGVFTIATGIYNSCEGIYVLTVNEHTNNAVNLSSPYEVYLYTPNVASGVPPVSGYPISSDTNIIDFSGLAPANYECIITNLLGQSVSTTFTINEAYAPIAQVNFAGFECEDSSQGMIDISVDGGSIPIAWSLLLNGTIVSTNINSDGSLVGVGTGNGIGTGDFDTVGVDIIISNLSSGEYSFVFEDDNGCGGNIPVSVLVPLPIVLEEPPAQNDVTCPGGSDGYFVFNASGGWTQAFLENIFNPLPPGNWGESYVFRLLNTTTNITYENPIISAIYDDDSSSQLYWQAYYSNLPAGTYTLTISETVSTASIQIDGTPILEYSCSKTFGPFVLTNPPAFDITETLTNVSCNGLNNGAISITTTGGTPFDPAPNYTYAWTTIDGSIPDDQENNQNLTGLIAGTYTVTVTDAENCTYTEEFTITAPEILVPLFSTQTNVTCNGGSDGSFSVTVTGGTPDYIFTLDGTTMSVTEVEIAEVIHYSISGLSVGTYQLVVTDQNDCDSVNIAAVIITEPDPITYIITPPVILDCNGDTDGEITGTVSGGTAPYIVTLSGTTTSETVANDGDIFAFSDLAAGTYSVTITDSTYNASGTPASDFSGCMVTTVDVIIEEPAPILIQNIIASVLACNNDSNGEISGIITGGTAPYEITLDSTSEAQQVTVDGGSFLFSNLSSGTYTFTIVDVNSTTGGTGCSTTATGTITEPLVLESSFVSKEEATCFETADGSITIAVVGGNPTYMFLINDVPTVPSLIAGDNYTFTGLLAGTHIIIVSDENDCITANADLSITITEPDALTPVMGAQTNVSCNGGSDGTFNLTVSGGTPDYIFTLDNSIISPTTTIISETTYYEFSGLAAGAHIVSVTDENSCIATTTITVDITEPLAITYTIDTIAMLDCFGDSDGVISGTISGGTAPYIITLVGTVTTYTVAADGGIFTFTGLIAGDFEFAITDANYDTNFSTTDLAGCMTTTTTQTVTEPSELILSTVDDILLDCNGDSNGEITGTVSGGTFPYQVTLSGTSGNTTAVTTDGGTYSFTGLSAGTYTITVTDANTTTLGVGCTTTQENITITEPDVLTPVMGVQTNVSCNGGSDGSFNITVSGGTPEYIFTLDDSIVSATRTVLGGETYYELNGLAAGTHTVSVTDENSCVATTTITVDITEPLAITYTVNTIASLDCFSDSDGIISGTISGGTAPYVITLDGTATTQNVNTDGGSFTFNGISSGNYTFTIVDVNNSSGLSASDNAGCMTTTTVQTVTEPSELILSTVDDILLNCNGDSDGEITGTVSGGTFPYQVTLSGTSGNTTAVTTDGGTYSFVGLTAGIYTVSVTDANTTTLGAGCTTKQESIEITAPDQISLESSVLSLYNSGTGAAIHISCIGESDGSISPSFIGGTGIYTYEWSTTDGSIPSNNETSVNLSGLIAGSYTVIVTDVKGCTATATFTLLEPRTLNSSTTVTSNNNCFGAENGTIVAQITSNGTVDGISYNYSISGNPSLPSGYVNSQSTTELTTTFANLPAGTYQITISDANDCTTVNTDVIIIEPTIELSVTGEITQYNGFQISCTNANDGEISITTIGGGGTDNVGDYSYAWTLGGTAFTVESPSTDTALEGLAPGIYEVTVTDDAGCDIVVSFTIEEPSLLDIIAIVSSYNGYGVSAAGANDGSIDLTLSGGTGEYTYAWTTTGGTIPVGDETSEDLIGLVAGSYTVIITDSNGCTITETYIITEPDLFTISEDLSAHVDVNCYGDNTGVLGVTITGGAIPYDYVLTDSGSNIINSIVDVTSTVYNYTGLASGIYTVTTTDANGILVSTMITIIEPNAALETIGVLSEYGAYEISCHGLNDGTITLTTIGGGGTDNVGDYSYAWTLGGTAFTVVSPSTDTALEGLAPGIYEVTVTDDAGCDIVVSFTIEEPSLLDIIAIVSSYNGYGVSAAGANDGSIDLTLSGGTGEYTYAWTTTGGTIPVGDETSEDLIGLVAGSYTVIITDSNGCTITETYDITEPQDLQITEEIAAHVNINCYGDVSGVLEVYIAQASVSPFDYTLMDGSGTIVSQVDNQTALSFTFNNLPTGVYSIMVTDANGNSKVLSDLSVLSPSSALTMTGVVTQYNAFQISCNSANDGEIVLTTSGGGGPTNSLNYTYNWTLDGALYTINSISVSNHLQALSPGEYAVIITDVSGCTVEDSFQITEPTALTLAAVISNYNGFGVSCAGSTDGEIDTTILGGTGTYVYLWSTTNGAIPLGQETQEDFSGLAAGSYTLIVTDTNNCQIEQTYVLSEPDPLLINEDLTQHVDVLCYAAVSGGLTVEINPTVAPYTFELTGTDYLLNTVTQLVVQAGLIKNYTGLTAGSYTLVVTDASGCVSDAIPIVITQPDDLIVTTTKTDVTCYGEANGSIDVTVTGGKAPYQISWSNLANGFSLSNLSADTYIATITDDNNCIKQVSITIEQPVFFIDPIVTSISCNGENDGTIDLNLTGGIAPFSVTWSDDASAGVQRNNLAAGTYTVLILDSDTYQCPIEETFIITNPPAIAVSTIVTDAIDCDIVNSGSIDLETSGGSAPYSFLWNTGETTEDIENIPPGDYSVEITDRNGCKVIKQFNIFRQEPLTISYEETTIIDCVLKTVSKQNTANATGGYLPYTYTWSDGVVSGTDNSVMTTMQSGSYTLTVTDAIGCIKSTSFIVDVPTIGDADFSYSAFALTTYDLLSIEDPIQFTNLSTGSYSSVQWDFGDGSPTSNEENPVHTYEQVGSFNIVLTVEFDIGCTEIFERTITITKGYSLIHPTAFTPNDDGYNETIRPSYRGFIDIKMTIYDTWGTVVYSEEGIDLKGWNGFIGNKPAENGNYVMVVKGITFYEKEIIKNSPVTLLK